MEQEEEIEKMIRCSLYSFNVQYITWLMKYYIVGAVSENNAWLMKYYFVGTMDKW
jgi:hypothetical protein